MNSIKDKNMVDVSATTIAEALVDKKAITAMQQHLINTGGEEKRYELLPSKAYKFYLNAGFTEEEKNLPILTLPVTVESVDKKQWVFVDLRKYVRPVEHENDLADMARDQAALNFELVRLAGMKSLADGNTELIDENKVFLARQMGFWLSGSYIAATYPLDADQRLRFMMAVFAYVVGSLDVDLEKDDGIIFHHFVKQFKVSTKYAKEVTAKITDSGVGDTKGIAKLVTLIRSVVDEEVARGISGASLAQSATNTWYGPNRFHNIPVAIENIPTWAAIYYTAATQRSYKKSPLNTMVGSMSKKAEVDKFIKSVDAMLYRETSN